MDLYVNENAMIRGRDIMVDIETLGVKPNSVMLTIGAVRFDPFSDDSKLKNGPLDMELFYARIDPESFTWPDADIDANTLKWWGLQKEEVREEAFSESDRKPIGIVMRDFYKWCQPFDRIWANGPAFDIVILEYICRKLERGFPWQYHQVRDARTIYKLIPNNQSQNHKNISNSVNPALHHAAWDCWTQVVSLQSCFKQLNITTLSK